MHCSCCSVLGCWKIALRFVQRAVASWDGRTQNKIRCVLLCLGAWQPHAPWSRTRRFRIRPSMWDGQAIGREKARRTLDIAAVVVVFLFVVQVLEPIELVGEGFDACLDGFDARGTST